jgi:hypothetical protein
MSAIAALGGIALKFGIGALASRYGIPDALKSEHGDPTSYMIFARLKIQ